MKVLITGGAGLIGSTCCKYFSEKGWQVINIDNNMRQTIFGKDANTFVNLTGQALGVGLRNAVAGASALVLPTGSAMAISLGNENVQSWQPVDTGTQSSWIEVDTAA